MKRSILLWAFAATAAVFSVTASVSAAQDVVVNGVNLGQCTNYTDGCNDCSVGADGQAACTMRYCFVAGTPKCLDEDTSLEDLENSGSTSTKAPEFSVKSFSSCTNMEDVLSKFISDYYKKNPNGYYGRPMPMDDVLYERVSDSAKMDSSNAVGTAAPSAVSAPQGSSGGGAKDYSQTNVQIGGVDESEIVKTDGSFTYFYNSDDHRVYVTDVRDSKNPVIVKKIKVPASYSNPEIYVANGKLVMFSSKYQQLNNPYAYWFDRSNKTVVVVYDVADPANPKIERYFQIDGSVTQSRRIGNSLYLLSNSNFSFPYERYLMPMASNATGKQSLDEKRVDKDFSVKKVMPKVVELSSDPTSSANFLLKGKRLPYRLESGDAATCSDIEYVLPDSATLEKYSFTPSFTTLSVIDLANPTAKTKTKVFFGDVNEILMTQNSLYVTSQLYSPTSWKCPPYARCMMPMWNAGLETLVHKFALNNNTVVKYAATAVVPGTPLNKYSMDEGSDGSFRIVTSETGEKRSTRVSILGKDLSLLGTLANIAPDENFQSSRFIGDKLYLVTFQQIDPLFVIDVADSKNPKIEGELKIPGYSVYLHPYADGKLIGLGYDTKTNQYGGIQNAGLKVDLYDVSDVKNPKRLQTLAIGGAGSSSDALWNPKLFTWNAAKHLLLLPTTVMESAGDANDPYRSKDAFQGTLAISINESGIKEEARLTHIVKGDVAAERAKECAQYAKPTTTPKCEKILGGGEYCPSSYNYVPPYCYESATDNEYFANHLWNYQKSFVLRNIYLDDTLYTLSNEKMVGHDMAHGYSTLSETLWK
ncbi:MAG: beta-propeller domain-containing protein [Patescibacteria group bacterium]